MEEDGGVARADAHHDSIESGKSAVPPTAAPFPARLLRVAVLALAATLWLSAPPAAPADTLSQVVRTHRLTFGADEEGGGPYVYPDPRSPTRITGFEVELIDRLASRLGARAVFAQGQWDTLLPILDSGRVDVVINGYEWTPDRARRYLATRPYYVYQLQLLTRRGAPLRSWPDVRAGSRRPWRIGVLRGSVAETFAQQEGGSGVRVVGFDGAADALEATANGQIDATLQDLPAARFYQPHFPRLVFAGPPVGHGYYVIYLRRNDQALCERLNAGITRLVESGELRTLYERYGVWTDAQEELRNWTEDRLPSAAAEESLRGWRLVGHYASPLLSAAGMTVFLSVTSMPLAMLLGLLIALGRLYGPPLLRWPLRFYVELIRGTPLMLQLYVLFFLLPRLGLTLDPLVAGVCGLAINYSAYEAEIYRAGLQAIPVGQMEAALALGMSRGLALRRVIVPQAVRIVIPPVTNDFIALFKDTSVCSVITLVELTKQYNILALSTGRVVEFGMAAAALYMAMSLPLSWFSHWFERRLAADAPRGGALA